MYPRSTSLLQQTTSELWCLSGGKRGDYQNCSVLYCVLKPCTVISTLRLAVLTVLWIGFCLTGPISLCVDSCVFVFVFCVFFCFTLISCCSIVSMVGWTWWDWNLILRTLSSFSALTLLVGSLTRKTVPDMTYNVFGGTLNLNQSLNLLCIYGNFHAIRSC